MSAETREQLYTVEQVADLLGCSPRTVRRHLDGTTEPRLDSLRIGKRSWRIRASAVDAFFRELEAAKR